MKKKTLNDLINANKGKSFGLWTVVDVIYKKRPDGRNRSMAVVVCECGAERVTALKDVVNGKSTNCGCVRNNLAAIRGKDLVTHGMSHTKEYKVWRGIKTRCYDTGAPEYKYYGARGISTCESWINSFEAFYSDMGEMPKGLSIDRIDNNKGYSPSNCRWATRIEQCNNRRSNTWLTVNGVCKTKAEWGREYNIDPDYIGARMKRGWSAEKAITTPVKKRNKDKT